MSDSHDAAGGMTGEGSDMSNGPAFERVLDNVIIVDQATVTSTVEVQGVVTIRTYSEGSVQRNIWESEERAHEYAADVAAQEG